jgi:hypothetical protein
MSREVEIPRPSRDPSPPRAAATPAIDPRRALAPSARVRALRRRADQLLTLLDEATPETIARILVTLEPMPKRPREAPAADAQAAPELAGLPSFALAAAAADYPLGRAGDGWRPTIAELASLASAKAAPFWTEAASIERALAEAALVGGA